MKVQLFCYNLTFKQPFNFKNKVTQTKKGLLISIDNKWGEIAPLEGFSRESYEEALNQTMQICEGEPPENVCSSVDFGFSSALKAYPHSLKHKISTLGITPSSQCSKIKVHHLSIDRCISLIKKIKSKHPHILLRLDCNQTWTLSESLFFAKHFDKTDFDYLEEPTKTFEETKEFYNKTGFPIALDETLYQNNFTFEKLQLACLILKPTMIGGTKKIDPFMVYAKKNGAKVSFSSSFESGIGLQNILGLASYYQDRSFHGLDTLKFFKNDILEKPLDVQKKTDKLFIKPNLKTLQKIGTWNISPALLSKL